MRTVGLVEKKTKPSGTKKATKKSEGGGKDAKN